MRKVTAKELLNYIWAAETEFRECMTDVMEDMKEDGGVSHTKLKRIAKKAASRLLKKIKKEERK